MSLWVTCDELGVHEVWIGATPNGDFPYECDEMTLECFIVELEGTVDNFKISTGDERLEIAEINLRTKGKIDDSAAKLTTVSTASSSNN